MMTYHRANSTTNMLRDNIARFLFSASLIENIGCTFSQIGKFVRSDEGSCTGIPTDGATKLLNLKRAARFLVEQSSYPVELGTLLEYNEIVGNDVASHPNPGCIREDAEVRISGSRTVPPIDSKDALRLVNAYREYSSSDDQAAYLAVALPKAQIFYDGNKRTSLLACNHLLCYADAGKLFLIDTEDARDRYIGMLLDFYDDRTSLEDMMSKAKVFLQ